MRNIILFTAILIVTGSTATGQGNAMAADEMEFKQMMQATAVTKEHIAKLIRLSKQFTKKPGETSADLNKAIQLANRAKELSALRQDKANISASLVALGIAYVEQDKGNDALNLVKQLDEPGKMELLLTWSARHCGNGTNREHVDSAIACVYRVLAMAQAGGYVDFELQAREHLQYIYSKVHDWPQVIGQLHAMLVFKNRKKPSDVLNDYFHLGIVYFSNLRQTDNTVKYALEAIQYGEKLVAPEELAKIYELLGVCYSRLEQYDKALIMFKTSLERHKIKNAKERFWSVTDWLVQAHLRLNQPGQALQLVLRAEKEFGFPVPGNLIVCRRLLGDIYLELKQLDLAEKCYREVIDIFDRKGTTDVTFYYFIGKYLYATGRLEKARHYLLEGLKLSEKFSVESQAAMCDFVYKIDSSNNNFASALHYVTKKKHLDDSVQQTLKARQMQSLLVQFETEKKDKDIKLKSQKILLLNSQHQLQQKDLEKAHLQVQYETEAKQQGIQLARAEAVEKDKSLQLKTQDLSLLRKETLIKENNLSQANVTRNITIVGAGLLLIILSLVYYQYRLKRQMSITLEGKNLALGHLLKEKELLLKEVHHRVKNNLHTIISLLETQSAFLTDDALAAIQNSQHRVYAMSLIHQKLYQVDNSTSVSMSTYLPELISYLKDSFTLGRQINFQTQIDDIELDVSQAIPIGLILNEAITNAIKYAFPGGRPGEITITMTQDRERRVCLTVADNGIGLPANWQSNTGGSLGLKLMQGLSGDIQGNFNIETIHGTKVTVQFKRETYGNTGLNNVL